MIFATTTGLFLSEEVQAGTPVTGDIAVDTVWDPSGSPYWIETAVAVIPGIELVVLAGTEVRFNGNYALSVNGRLLVDGNATDPVVFTYNGTTPSPGDWAGIMIFGEAHINFANISYADVGVYIASSYNTVNNSFFYRNWDGIDLVMGTDNVIRDNTLYNNTYCGVVIWQSTSNELIGNNATRNGDTGIWLHEASDNVVSHNTLYRNYWNGIRLWVRSSLNEISNNTVLESQLYQGIGIWDSHDNWILNNTIRRNNNNGIYLELSSGNYISGNEISDSVSWHGISVWRSNDNSISNNTISQNAVDGIEVVGSRVSIVDNDIKSNDHDGIGLWDDSSAWIEGNLIESNLVTGIKLSHWATPTGSNATIVNNRILSNGFTMGWNYPGIFVNSDPYVPLIQNNTISQNAFDGIEVVGSRVSIVDNDISLNGRAGVALESSTAAAISGNNISSNNGRGILLISSANATITGNNLSNNGFGISLYSSGNIRVHHNNLVNNMVQAYDDSGSQNAWDDGYPSGGNYWSDYTGSDVFSGPNQDQPGCDGIGDEPHVIDSDSQDDYPLMYPFGAPASLPPGNLDAHLNGKGLENVTITWDLSGDDGSGKGDVVGYRIYRGSEYDSNGNAYVFLGNVSNGMSTYTDCYVGEGNPSNYFYQVCAINTLGIPSCSPNQAGKFTRPLAQGPNLVSIPLIQSNESIETVLQTVKYDRAWFYDSSSQEWKWYVTFKNYRRGLWSVNHTMGLWVNATGDSNLTVAGIVPANTPVQLHRGWNLVGFPSFNSTYTVSDLKAEVGATRVEGFDSSALPYCLGVLGDGEVLQAGYGYWVRVEADTVWIAEVT